MKMKKQVMIRAWALAKEGQRKFGGKVSEYFAQALKIAWAETKENWVVKVTALVGYKKTYVAKIKGTHPKWKFDREFLKPDEKERSYSGKTGYDIFYITENGVFEKVSNGNKEYFIIKNGTKKQVEYEYVLKIVG